MVNFGPTNGDETVPRTFVFPAARPAVLARLRILASVSAITAVLTITAEPSFAQQVCYYVYGQLVCQYAAYPGTGYGGGYDQGRDQSWSHYDPDSHFSTGSDGKGCYYAGDWSNC